MSGENRDLILANFQACTGIEDIEVAMQHLQQANWNLIDAIQRVLPHSTQQLPSERVETILPPNPAMNDSNSVNSVIPQNNFTEREETPVAISTEDTQTNTPRPTTDGGQSSRNNLAGSESSGSTSEMEDLDLTESYADEDDYYAPDPPNVRRHHQQRYLISDNTADETAGTMQLLENFALRYGNNHPNFVVDGLDAAIREATVGPARDRKLLAIYIHHDESVQANIFCQEVLCSEAIGNMLRTHFVIWGWDVTHESNRQHLIASVGRSFGTAAMTTIRSIDRESYPVILLGNRSRGTMEITTLIPGAIAADELMASLLGAVEIFTIQQAADIREEAEREARERVIREQNEAYEESLRADKAKDVAKLAVEAEKKREQDEKLAEGARLAAERQKVLESLVPEPSKDTTEPVCSLRCRLPDGRVVSRRFLQSSTLQDLFDFLFAEGYSIAEFKVLFSYPKKDLTEQYEENQAIGTVFASQDTLILEGR